METSVEHCWNGAAGGKRECWEKNLLQGHFVRQKTHMDETCIESGPLRLEAGN
jgi:hypothetical protein